MQNVHADHVFPAPLRLPLTLLAAGLLIATPAGCLSLKEDYVPHFSPDGEVFVQGRRDGFAMGPDFEVPAVAPQHIFLDFYAADRPHEKQTVKVFSSGAECLGVPRIAFSPGSRMVAVWESDRLAVVDVETGAVTECARTHHTREGWGRIGPVFWRGDDHVYYAILTCPQYRLESEQDETYRCDWIVYRRNVTRRQGKPEIVYRTGFRITNYGLYNTMSQLSAAASLDGRHVVSCGMDGKPGLCLLDVETGRARRLEGRGKYLRAAAWRPDAKRALCQVAVGILPPNNRIQYAWLLADVQAGGTRDVTAALDQHGEAGHAIWTADGRYLLVRARDSEKRAEYVLLDPDTKEVIPIGRLLRGKLSIRELHVCALAGRLLVCGDEGHYYLTDYRAAQLQEIPGNIVSPDGRRVLHYDEEKGSVRIHDLKPRARSAP